MVSHVIKVDGYSALAEEIDVLHSDLGVLCLLYLVYRFRFVFINTSIRGFDLNLVNACLLGRFVDLSSNYLVQTERARLLLCILTFHGVEHRWLQKFDLHFVIKAFLLLDRLLTGV